MAEFPDIPMSDRQLLDHYIHQLEIKQHKIRGLQAQLAYIQVNIDYYSARLMNEKAKQDDQTN